MDTDMMILQIETTVDGANEIIQMLPEGCKVVGIAPTVTIQGNGVISSSYTGPRKGSYSTKKVVNLRRKSAVTTSTGGSNLTNELLDLFKKHPNREYNKNDLQDFIKGFGFKSSVTTAMGNLIDRAKGKPPVQRIVMEDRGSTCYRATKHLTPSASLA